MAKKRKIIEKGVYEVFFDGNKKIEIAKIRFMPDKKFTSRMGKSNSIKPAKRDLIVSKIRKNGLTECRFRNIRE